MSYFETNYDKLTFIHSSSEQIGLRTAQIGAIYSLAGHFTTSLDPAIVVMPTGSGKSVVLMAACFLLRAKRVLILTPSKLLRNQIAEDFSSLVSLKKFRVVPVDLTSPKIKEVSAKLDSLEKWNELRKFDVIIATPNCVSPGHPGITTPPEDLFDVVFVDEAHHSPARTWREILDSFPKARKALLTATPYRNDKKEINGKFVFTYGMRQAKADGIFGAIEFSPVPNARPGDDAAIAIEAERIINDDRKNRLEHFLVVRTDSKKKADELHKLYAERTKLKLKVLHSGHSYKAIKATIKELRSKELDGVIAVAMLGEGFDFPNLKVAAIHAPHRSLAVTLQFIGRFARSGTEAIGKARFIAIPDDIRIESEKLYEEGASWEEMITNLSETKIESEIEIQERLDSFSSLGGPIETDDFSLGSLTPYSHVKIYLVKGGVDLRAELSRLQDKDVIEDFFSEELNARILLCRSEIIPKWSATDSFAQIDHDLHVVYHHKESGLLFVNSSNRTAALHEEIAKAVCLDGHQILSLSEVNRVIRNIRNPEFFNIGMKNSVTGGKTESYRIISGPSAQRSVSRTDSALFHRGHVFGKGVTEDGDVTIGYSSASKVWSHTYVKIPMLINWCKSLALKVQDESPVTTNSNLDLLQVGERVRSIEAPVLFCDWNPGWLAKDLVLKDPSTNQKTRIWDCDIRILGNSSDRISFAVDTGTSTQELEYRLNESPHFISLGGCRHITDGVESVELVTLLNSDPLSFYLADLSRIRGRDRFRAELSSMTLNPDTLQRLDWTGVDITKETNRGRIAEGSICIQDKLEQWLVAQDYELVILDDRAGEIADFVCIKQTDSDLTIDLYHVKASASATPGARVEDLYEVCGQAAKSFLKTNRVSQTLTRLEDRLTNGSRFAKGDITLFRALKKAAFGLRPIHTIIAVQPGVNTKFVTEPIAAQILAVESFVSKIQDATFRLIGS